MFAPALLLTLSLTAQTAPAPAPSKDALSDAYLLFLQGRDLDDRNDAAGAVTAYRKALALCPDAADIHAELAGVYARDGQTDAAFKEAAAAVALEPDNRSAHRLLGLLKAEAADRLDDEKPAAAMRSEAVADLEIGMADRLVDPTVELALGRLYVQTGKYEKAVETLRVFLLDRPDYADAKLLLATAYEYSHDVPSAIDVLQDVATAQPTHIRLWTWLADLQEQASQWQAAAATWGHVASANPKNQSYKIRQAAAAVNGGDVSGGRRILAAALEQNSRDVAGWYLLSQIDRRAGDSMRAEQDARKIAEIDKADPRGPLALAEAKAAHGDYRGVVAVLDSLVREPRAEDVENGWFARMAGQLATALGEIGDKSRAVAVLEAAHRRDTQNAELLFELGTAYERAKRFDRAEQALRELIGTQPRNAEALNYLGYMLTERGARLDEAVELISRALAIEADNPSYLDSLGWAYVKQAKLDSARDPLQRAAAALPKTSVIQDHLAELYFRLKLYREAADTWDRALAGDRGGIDVEAVTKKRDKARTLAAHE